MRKLYLTSFDQTYLPTLFSKPPNQIKLAFIPTAAEVYEDTWFVEKDRQVLSEMGFQLQNITLTGKNQAELRNVFAHIDGMYVSGGNSFYLLQEVRKSGFDILLPELLEKGVVYAGGSAGAVIAGTHLEPLKTLDDPHAAPELTDYHGLGLVPFVILPHYGKEKYLARYDAIVSTYSDKYKLQTLTDAQAIVVEGESWKIVDLEVQPK